MKPTAPCTEGFIFGAIGVAFLLGMMLSAVLFAEIPGMRTHTTAFGNAHPRNYEDVVHAEVPRLTRTWGYDPMIGGAVTGGILGLIVVGVIVGKRRKS